MSDDPQRAPPRLSESDEPIAAVLRRARDAGDTARPGARERVWRQMQNGPQRQSSWRPALVAAAAVAVVAIAVTVWPRRSVEIATPTTGDVFATVMLAAGDVQATRGDASQWQAARVGEHLPTGAQLRTAAASRAYTRFTASGALFHAGTRARLSRDANRLSLSLDEGSLAAALHTRSAPVEVRAADFTLDATAPVDSVVFFVQTASDRSVDLVVHQGSVHVKGPSTDVRVDAGQSWSSRTGRGTRSMQSADIAAVSALASSQKDEAVLRVLRPEGALVSVDGVELGNAPLAVVTAVGSHQVSALHRGTRLSQHADVSSEGAELDLPLEPLPALSPPAEAPRALAPAEAERVTPLEKTRTTAKSQAERDTASYELARLLTRRGQHAESLALYEQIARGSSGWAESAQYEVGRLKLRYLSDPDGAAIAFAAYRSEHPHGALSPEVALSSIEARLAAHQQTAALRELDDFVAQFPRNERLGDVRLVRATLHRHADDCAAALADYRALLTDARHADDALYFTAWCERQQGDLSAAGDHFRAYRERFPAGRHAGENF